MHFICFTTSCPPRLRVIEGEIAEMSASLAQGNLDNLATRERYLQIRYREDGVDG